MVAVQQQGGLRSLSMALFSPKNDVAADNEDTLQYVERSILSIDTTHNDLATGDDIGRVLSYDSDDDCSLDKNDTPIAAAMRVLDYCSSIQENTIASKLVTILYIVLGLCFASVVLVVPLTVGAALQFSSAVWPWMYFLSAWSYMIGVALLCIVCKCIQWLCKPVLALVHYLQAPPDTLEYEIEVEPDYTVYEYNKSSQQWRAVMYKKSGLEVSKNFFAGILATILSCGRCLNIKFWWSIVVLAAAVVSFVAMVASIGCNMFCH